MRKGTGTVLQFFEASRVIHPRVFCAATGDFFMRVRRSGFAALLFASIFVFAGVNSAQATQKHAARKAAVPETTVEVVPAPPPPPPPRPEQMPPVAPQVTYQNGKLTIIARNSTLGDILRAVHTKTGANIEVPGSAPERVVGMFGPGPSRDVMATLLNGSHFNYVMLGSATNPNQLERLILTAKTGGGETPPTPQPVAQNQPVPDVQPDAPDQDANNDDFSDASSDADPVDSTSEDQANQGQQIGQPNAKTPEQLLLELQRQQQLQQQQQQQQNGVPPQGFPPGVRPPNPPQ
jgi:hypothetical protein